MARLNPRIDIAFKKIFGVEENKDLLMSLINAIVSPEDQVDEITLMNPYNLQSFKTDKLSIMDIKAKSVDGKRFNIEIQITDEGDYDKRALLYWSKMYADQLRVGSDYSDLSKAIGIHILNFTSIPDVHYHHKFHVHDDHTKIRYFHDFEMHTLELSKFSTKDDQLNDLVRKIRTSLDMWMAFLTRNDLLVHNHLPHELENNHLNKAIHVLDVMNLTDDEREAYEGRVKFLMIEASALHKQREDGKVEGLAEGIQIGKAEGLAEGKAEGLAEGKAEGKEEAKREMALKMLLKNKDDEEVMEFSGLSRDELTALKERLR